MTDKPSHPEELRGTDDEIMEDTLVLQEIERESQELPPDDPRRSTLRSAARNTAEELRREAGDAVQLAREVAETD